MGYIGHEFDGRALIPHQIAALIDEADPAIFGKINDQLHNSICHEPNEWLHKPNATVNYIFDANASLGLNNFNESRFKRYAEQYDINPTTYGAIIKGTNGYNLQPMDIQPKNRKYPIIAINMTTHKRCKCTTQFIKRRLAEA